MQGFTAFQALAPQETMMDEDYEDLMASLDALHYKIDLLLQRMGIEEEDVDS